MPEGAHLGVRNQQIGYLHHRHAGRERGTYARRRVLEHQALRRRHAEACGSEEVDIRGGLGMGHVAAGAYDVEAPEQARPLRACAAPVASASRSRPHAASRACAPVPAGRQGPADAARRFGDRDVARMPGGPTRFGRVIADQCAAHGIAAADQTEPAVGIEVEPVHRRRVAAQSSNQAIKQSRMARSERAPAHPCRRSPAPGRIASGITQPTVAPISTSMSSPDRMRHAPSGRSPSASPPTRLRCSATTWLPVAANIRRTWW